MAPSKLKNTNIRSYLATCKTNFIFVIVFSFFINLLLFVSPLYMLQVYDRVLASRNETTLVMVTILAVALLIVWAALEAIRSRILVRSGAKFDRFIGKDVFSTSFRGHLRAPNGQFSQPIRDLDTLREFLTGGAIITFCDAPWMPFFLAVCYLIHPWIGVIATVGAVGIFALALANELMTRRYLKEASTASIGANQYVSTSLRNVEVVHALGMMNAIGGRWNTMHDNVIGLQAKASDRAGMLISTSKFLRMVLQIAILGVGAYLVLEAEITPGAMIASSILMGRALQPVEGAVAQWKGFVAARSAYSRLQDMFNSVPAQEDRMALPTPVGQISIEQLIVAPPGSRIATLKSVNMQIQPGEVVGVIGPSGSGKSTFARALTGVWAPMAGHVRIDGADIDNWDPEKLGPHMGYLPQDVELFSGTIAENIGRFSQIDAEAVVAAAKTAGVHDMILQMSDGYNTPIGEAGRSLSGGQRQRIGLARALYGNPKIIVLDEPNSSLDSQGEAALANAIRAAKANGCTVVVISHRTALLNTVDKLAVFTNGTLTMYGPTKAVLERLNGTGGDTAAPQNLPQGKPMGQVTQMARAGS
ncbi:type I secretion system permease/ATPase [Fulvimarina sp. 2208YS6-2-32]|uniref:Type I secretion system permease/ATPase n=1 Tax=Fulvimarina uroteuthidis TaxID=3098149 RepID=A0ABU5I0H0_9HYPH|nr:type I secretion system permease/ATPase [Fulvimarina sp. 2208YS6-2-32]MDY8108847.1 type I secretion system permease/ATPase [Fulvimarina sp. 2208YS6-2-32]